MNIIGALDRATAGSYTLDNIVIEKAEDRELSTIRNRRVGFVFQNFNLIPRTNALKNVELPMMYAGMGLRTRSERARELLAMVGMEDRLNHRPNELSGGEKQRVAIARAMANDPAIILADEPTGSLDSKTGSGHGSFSPAKQGAGQNHRFDYPSTASCLGDRVILTMHDGLLFNEQGAEHEFS